MRVLTVLGLLFVCVSARAEAPDGMTTFYDAPTTVNLAGRPVVADIALHSDKSLERLGLLRVALTTDVTKFVVETELDLKNWIAARQDRCGERWSSGDPKISFPASEIRFSIDLEIELWTCGVNGKAAPSRIAREGGSVVVRLAPYVADGKLQARLEEFSLGNRRGLSKYMPLEFVVKAALDQELNKLNNNPKFYRAPEPLHREAFHYEEISANVSSDERVVITAIYAAPGAPSTLTRLADAMRTEGVTQKPTPKN